MASPCAQSLTHFLSEELDIHSLVKTLQEAGLFQSSAYCRNNSSQNVSGGTFYDDKNVRARRLPFSMYVSFTFLCFASICTATKPRTALLIFAQFHCAFNRNKLIHITNGQCYSK